jgi:hypothetical protein
LPAGHLVDVFEFGVAEAGADLREGGVGRLPEVGSSQRRFQELPRQIEGDRLFPIESERGRLGGRHAPKFATVVGARFVEREPDLTQQNEIAANRLFVDGVLRG